jgi:hypothetical protein
MGEGDFCVSAIATIDPSKSELFEKALRELQANLKPSSKVEDVRVYLEVN